MIYGISVCAVLYCRTCNRGQQIHMIFSLTFTSFVCIGRFSFGERVLVCVWVSERESEREREGERGREREREKSKWDIDGER